MTSMTASRSTKIRRGLGWSVIGNIVLRIGNVSMSILMARLIAPEQFGVFAVALTVWSILGTLAEFGLGSDLVRAADLERRVPTVAVLGLVTSVGLAGSMVLAAAPIAAAFQSPESAGVIRLMAVSIAIFGLAIVPAARLQRDFRQGALFGINGVGLLASAATMTTLALQDVGPAALAWGQIANQAAIVIGLYAVTRTRPRAGFDRQIARESIGFCLPLALANLVSWLLISVDNLVVARVLGPFELGLYVLAFNVSSWPMTALGQSLRVVALPAFSQVESREDRNLALVRCVAPAVAVATLMALVLSTMAGPVIDLLYGARWGAAASALSGLAVFGGLRVVLDLVATFLIAIGATTEVLLVQVAWLVVMVPAMAAGVSFFGLAGAGWTHVLVAVAVVLPLYVTCLRRAGVDTTRFLREAVTPLVAAVPAVVVCGWIGSRDGPPALALLAVGGTAALLIYALPLGRWWLRRIDLLRQPLTSEHHSEERA
jgi:lipopolysaccharide exporter